MSTSATPGCLVVIVRSSEIVPFDDGLPFLAFAPSMITLLLLFASFTHPPELLCVVAYVMAQNFTAGYQLHRLVLTNGLLCCRHLGLQVDWCSDKPNRDFAITSLRHSETEPPSNLAPDLAARQEYLRLAHQSGPTQHTA